MACALTTSAAVAVAVLDDGGFNPGPRELFSALALGAVTLSALTNWSLVRKAVRQPVIVVLLLLALVGAASAVWTIGNAGECAPLGSRDHRLRRRRNLHRVSGPQRTRRDGRGDPDREPGCRLQHRRHRRRGQARRPVRRIFRRLLAPSRDIRVRTSTRPTRGFGAARAAQRYVLEQPSLGRSGGARYGDLRGRARARPQPNRRSACDLHLRNGRRSTRPDAPQEPAHRARGCRSADADGGIGLFHRRAPDELRGQSRARRWPPAGRHRRRRISAMDVDRTRAQPTDGVRDGSRPSAARWRGHRHRHCRNGGAGIWGTTTGQIPHPGNGGFSHGRLHLWSAAVHVAEQRPVYRFGADSFLAATFTEQDRFQPPIRYAHDLPLELAVELGIPGFVLALALYGASADVLRRQGSTIRVWLLGPAVAAFLVANLIDWSWHLAGSGAIWAAAVGGTVAATRGAQSRQLQPPGRQGDHADKEVHAAFNRRRERSLPGIYARSMLRS